MRQTPFTAIESPARELAGQRGAHAQARAAAVALHRLDRALVRHQPGEHQRSPLVQPRDDQHVVVDPLGLHRERACAAPAIVLGARCPPPRCGPRAPPARTRRHEHPRLVDLARLEERARPGAGRPRAAATGRRARPSSSSASATRARLVLARGHDHVHVRALSSASTEVREAARDATTVTRHLGHARHQLARHAAGGPRSRRPRGAAGATRPRSGR